MKFYRFAMKVLCSISTPLLLDKMYIWLYCINQGTEELGGKSYLFVHKSKNKAWEIWLASLKPALTTCWKASDSDGCSFPISGSTKGVGGISPIKGSTPTCPPPHLKKKISYVLQSFLIFAPSMPQKKKFWYHHCSLPHWHVTFGFTNPHVINI